jgi:glycine/D-amino acid oxidase-like deaminating enzyme
MQNPYFNSLPFAPNKGEALIIKVPGLPNKNIYKNNISVVPWDDDLFWVGASYEWSFNDVLPTQSFREKMIQNLDQFMQLPYEVVDHVTGIRPANSQRRPFVGVHPQYSQLAICNGMGTKGCSLAPFFTHQLREHLETGTPIEPEANLERFAFILNK